MSAIKPMLLGCFLLLALTSCAPDPSPDRWERQARFNCLAGEVVRDCQTALRLAAAKNLDPWLRESP